MVAKTPEGGKQAVIRGLVNAILMCGMLIACPEFLPAGGCGTSFTRQLGCENDRDSPELPARLYPGYIRHSGLKILRYSCAEERQFLT